MQSTWRNEFSVSFSLRVLCLPLLLILSVWLVSLHATSVSLSFVSKSDPLCSGSAAGGVGRGRRSLVEGVDGAQPLRVFHVPLMGSECAFLS